MMRIFRGWIDFLKSQNKASEDSVGFRLSVGVTVMIAILATAWQLEWPLYSLVCLALTPLGMVLSYRWRKRNNWEIKAVLSVLMVITLVHFFVALSQSVYDPRIPLAELLLWLQTLHSWDLPARRDLNYSLVVGLILMSIGAVLSLDMTFGLCLLAFCLAALVSLQFNYLSLVRHETGLAVVERGAWRGQLRNMGWEAVAMLAVGALVFLAMPRYQSLRLRALPFSWQLRLQLPKVSRGQVVNPEYPSTRSREEFRRQAKFNSDSYYGFNPLVDLNLRGTLSNELVMRVRSTRPCYLRGMTFDAYDGQFWSQSSERLTPINSAFPPLYLPTEVRGRRENVQIVYVVRRQPNIIFSSPEAYQLYFPSEEVFLDTGRGIRSPYPLDEGTVYSVISLEQDYPLEKVRRLAPRDGTLHRLRRYLELPPISERLKQLAAAQTEGHASAFDRAEAICLYLKGNYRYTLDVPAYPVNRETADYFLFEQKQGYCEQFATAMAVMCRSQGLHARYVTGYLPGRYNPFTGYQEIHGGDAHAWVEVYIPNLGWLAFDPTPGAESTPDLSTGSERGWLVGTLLRYLGLSDLQDLRRQAMERLRQIRLPGLGPELSWFLILGAGLGLVGLVRASLVARWRVQRSQGPVAMAYHQALAALGRRGLARSTWQTPREFAAGLGLPELDELTGLFERACYGAEQLPEDLVQRARSLARDLARPRKS